jgi:hypothetical protein
MKYSSKHFKFKTKSRRFKLSVWKKYYDLKKKKPAELSEYDKFWMRQLRAKLKVSEIKLIGTHVPSGVVTEWTVKKEVKNRKEYLFKLLMKVQDKRKSARKVTTINEYFEGAHYNTVGGVFTKADSIKPLSQFLTTNNPMAPKRPRHKNKNYIGIELEFNQINGGPGQNQIANTLKAAGLAKYVDVTTDGSCGWEVRVLLLEEDFETTLKSILACISGMGFTCNSDCGTHVHFDMRNRDVKLVYQNLFKTQKFLRKFLTRNRKYNMYCKINKADTFEKQLSLGDRRHAINVEAFQEHRTIEVRMHQGTLNPNELIPWIKLLLKVSNYKVNIESSVNTLKQAKKQFDIEDQLVQNLEERLLTVFSRAKTAAPNVIVGPLQGTGTLLNWLGIN